MQFSAIFVGLLAAVATATPILNSESGATEANSVEKRGKSTLECAAEASAYCHANHDDHFGSCYAGYMAVCALVHGKEDDA